MRRSRSGYGGYRGRRTLHDVLKIVAIALGALVVLALAALLLGQRFIVFTDGSVRLELPFLGADREESPDPGNVSVIIDEGDGSEDAPPDPANEKFMAALELPLQSVLDGTAEEELARAGANALVLEMKGPEGTLAWGSGQELAVSLGLSTGDEAVNGALRAWNAGEVYTVARLCCFRDDAVPYQRGSLSLRSGGGSWRDELGLRWLHPGDVRVQEYLSQLCGELAALGFDEILLECAGFPTRGALEQISWGDYARPAWREGAVEVFLDACVQAVEPYGTTLSLRLDGEALDGGASGLTPELLSGWSGRLWAEAPGGMEELEARADQAGLPAGRLVAVAAALEPGAGFDRAALDDVPPETE